MDFDELRKILEMVREHALSEFELEREGFKIRIKKGIVQPSGVAQGPASAAAIDRPPAPEERLMSAPERAADIPAGDLAQAEAIELAVVKSPIVGTFFAAPEPGAPPFVAVGAMVKKGQVLCIIEAMKLMNEIDSEYDGEIVSVFVENGQPVQYGERLFAIKARRD